jgi:hypothetical protein
MGTYKWDGFSTWLIQMGETPNTAWTQASKPKASSPFQLRGSPKTDGFKPLLERRGQGHSAPKIKITRKSTMILEIERMSKHFKDHGMFTITCLPDPRNPTEMVSVLQHSSLFTVTTANRKAKEYRSDHWDTYDISNDP